MASQDWFSDRAAQLPYVENILYRRRGWSWITEGDAKSLVGLSQVKSIYEKPLTGDLVKGLLRLGAPLAKEAWERVGKDPGSEAFANTKAIDMRGLPVWEIDRWTTF